MKEINEDFFKYQKKDKIRTVEEVLDPGEKVLWRGRPKKFSYAINKSIAMMPIAIIWAIIDIAIITFLIKNVLSDQPEFLFFIIPFFALHLAPVWVWLGMLIKASKEMWNTQYVITNERVLEIKGKDLYVSTNINLNNISTANLSQSIIDKTLSVGDIYITGTTGSMVLFDVPNSEFIYTRINKIIKDELARESEFYKENVICEHCGSYYKAQCTKCPNCGAPTRRD